LSYLLWSVYVHVSGIKLKTQLMLHGPWNNATVDGRLTGRLDWWFQLHPLLVWQHSWLGGMASAVYGSHFNQSRSSWVDILTNQIADYDWDHMPCTRRLVCSPHASASACIFLWVYLAFTNFDMAFVDSIIFKLLACYCDIFTSILES